MIQRSVSIVIVIVAIKRYIWKKRKYKSEKRDEDETTKQFI